MGVFVAGTIGEPSLRVLRGARAISAGHFAGALCWSPGPPGGRGRGTIRIRYRKAMQDRALHCFHAARLRVIGVIIAEKMQEAVHRQMGEMVIELFTLAAGLAPDGLVSEYDVAQMRAKLFDRPIAGAIEPVPIVGIFGRK